MTRDEIAQAMQDTAGSDWGTEAHFQRFAALVAAAEREECAKLADNAKKYNRHISKEISAAIRARGK